MDSSGTHRGVSCFTAIQTDEFREHIDSERFFWVDLDDPSDEQIESLGALFGFHPLAVEDAREFHQRPKLDLYGDHVFLVFFGAALGPDAQTLVLNEVH